MITNAAQQVVWRRDNQEPFGDSPPDENPSGLGVFEFDLGFPGQRRDRETGLWYNGERDGYNPAIGGFTQPEPLGLFGDINLYRYARSNPLSFIDPDGRQAIPIGGGAIGGGSGAAGGFGGLGGFGGKGTGGKSSSGTGSRELDEALGLGGRSGSSASSSDSSSGQQCKPDNKDECEELLRIDTSTCNGITRVRGARAGAICHASASQRYAECLRHGLSGVRTPLATWNN